MRWLQSNPEVGYHPEDKKRFETEARKLMKDIESFFPLVSQSKVEYNPAGIAVSGDVTLKLFSAQLGYGVYISLHTPSTHGLMFRRIVGMKDTMGGPNNWLQLKDYKNPQGVAERIMGMMNWNAEALGKSNDFDTNRNGSIY